MDRFDLKTSVKTRIFIRGYDAAKQLVFANVGHNTFTYAASDIIVNGLLGKSSSVVSRLYGRFTNNTSASPGTLTSTSAGLATTVRSNFLDTTDSNCGGFWIDQLSTPYQLPNGVNYVGNQATFYFRVAYNMSAQDGSFSSSSYISALGLAVPFDPNDPTQDKIFSALNYTSFANPTQFAVPSGGQIAIDYSFYFTS